MKKRFVVPAWVLLLTIVLLLAACGPATPAEDATVEPVATEEAIGDEAATDEEAAVDEAPVGIPTVEGPTTTTDSGLVYIETLAGDGRTPEEGDIVTMNIVGMLDDGTVFADTYTDGAPITATATDDDLFVGWKEGLLLMKEGGKARLIIPPDLAFGSEGAGGVIPPDATVTMDIELISAEAPPTPTAVDEADLTTTDSGLQYYDITVGEGDMPVEGQEVVVNYVAWLQDGEQFIASSANQGGEPLTFAIGSDSVFPGWEEGVMTMQKGGKRLLVIPPDLALGEEGGGTIPPNSTLLMEVELVDVLPLVLPTAVDEADFTTTESGLKYYDIVEGDGEEAVSGMAVTVDYTGWLTSNIKFDSSLDAGQPFTFTLGSGGVIPGWDEGVAGMKVGGKRQLVIPAELGYGETGGGIIPPNATLIFEVELLEVAEAPTE
jgi:peptidylprolyl isomerase